ncbi:hypothetical protein CWATWH0401_4528 [Crocosphaera watsonii WH 0401]|uniref:Uncharacterized protein n=1 Tax=Crocosphaera watsonii WH 0401 TaxID=555881 RepID=T2JA02_CROWT|nr:hypothetical protein CWATWH0401_4528 [Crocosphaera watsonii WH 0401]
MKFKIEHRGFLIGDRSIGKLSMIRLGNDAEPFKPLCLAW